MRTRLVVVALTVLAAAARSEAACTLSATGVAFGVYNVFQTSPSDSTGTITYRCAAGDSNIRIAISTGSSGTFSARTLVDGTETVAYNLFTNAGRSQIWGDGTGGSTVYTRNNPPNNQDVVLTVFARVPAGQDVRIGSYSDLVVVTLEY